MKKTLLLTSFLLFFSFSYLDLNKFNAPEMENIKFLARDHEGGFKHEGNTGLGIGITFPQNKA
ncbi:MAG: hypothetical protein WBA61_06030 [Aequorivita sp.]